MGLVAKDKNVVVPGEILADGMDYLPGKGTYRHEDKIYSNMIGLMNLSGRALKIIPLAGKYNPRVGDVIIGQIIDVSFTGWRVDTNSAYSAMLSMKDATSEYIQRGADLTQYFNLGDWISTKIITVTSQNLIDLTMKGPGLRKLKGGRLINVSPNKVPRIIGKQGSMVTLIKENTNCKIVVGQNGVVWIEGDPKQEILVVNTIRKIEAESHIRGLTERIKEYLEKNKVSK